MVNSETELSSESALDDFYSALLDDDPSALYEKAPCGYLTTLPDGTITKVNQTFLTLTGFERQDLIGKRTFAELLTAGGRIYHETHYAPMLQMQGSAREIAFDIICSDDRRLPVLVNSVLERDPNGAPVVVRTAVFDATHRREYERELLRAKERAEASEERATLLAKTLQQTLMPPKPPEVPGLEMGAAYRPAGRGDEVGGDFYDVFEVRSGDWVVVLGDVCGKGVGAAVVTALARHTIRALAVHEDRPAQILRTLNEVLIQDGTDRFCTVALVRLRRVGSDWDATLSCAGHPPPVLLVPGHAPQFVGPLGQLLGVVPDAQLQDEDFVLRAGERLVLYTDGVTEARAGADLFGEDRLVAALARLEGPPEELVEGLLGEIMLYQSEEPRDDIAIFALGVPQLRS